MNSDRRDFIKKSLLGAGAVMAGIVGIKGLSAIGQEAEEVERGRLLIPALTTDGKLIYVDASEDGGPREPASDEEVRRGIPGRKWVMVIDLAKCDGCEKCTEACIESHFTPPEREWIKVYKMQDSPKTARYWFPKPCFHCDRPPCTTVCPVNATFKRLDGIVLIDNRRCVGCKFCMAACPYSSRFFNWEMSPELPPRAKAHPYTPEAGFPRRVGTVEKCDFCVHWTLLGKLTPCTLSCPNDAIYFGDENEDAVTCSSGETLWLSKLLKERAAYRFLEELGTEPRVYYLPPSNPIHPPPRKL